MERIHSFLGIFSGAILFWLLFVRRATKTGAITRRRALSPDSLEYNCTSSSLPIRASGLTLRLLRHLTNTWVGRILLNPQSKRQTNLDFLSRLVLEDTPTYEPVMPAAVPTVAKNCLDTDLEYLIEPQRKKSTEEFCFATVSDYYHAYRSGLVTPEDVAESVMEAVGKTEQMKPNMRIVTQYDVEEVYKMAKEATARINNKTPLSIFDGVPVVIKEELAVAPYHLRSGTSFFGRDPEKVDCSSAAKLRAGGAVIIGVSNMHELGLGVLGINVSPSGTARNPYNTQHFTGGSSAGSAACLAAGLCPIAIGSDGGGSIRIPSALCGVVGIKPTHGRVSRHGTMELCRTVSVVGPMTTCVRDTAMMLEYLSGEDPQDSATWGQPPLKLGDLQPNNLNGVKIGIDWRHFRDANAEVVAECEKAVAYLEENGAELVGIQIPEFEELRVAHMLLISSEMLASLKDSLNDHLYDMAADTALVLRIASSTSATDYVNANKQRTRTIHYLKGIFQQVDVIVCPGCAVTAPRIEPGDLDIGVNDTVTTMNIMRFAPLANVTGIPGLAVPVGYDARNLPISLQIMAPWWEEARALRVGAVAEGLLKKKHQPQVHFDILKDAMQQKS